MPLDVITGGKHNPFDKFNTPNSAILFPVGERATGWQQRDGNFRTTKAYKAIIRLNEKGDDAVLLNYVGRGYRLVHNRELFGAVEDSMVAEMQPHHLEDVQVKDKVSGWGRTCFREYTFPSIRHRLTNTVGDIAFRIVVQNGYGGSALRIFAGAIDFWCMNGMFRGEFVRTYRRHTKHLEISKVNDTITKALEDHTNATAEWQRWSETPVKHDKVIQFLKDISSSAKMYDGLVDKFMQERETRGNNLWAAYSTLTHYASHPEGRFVFKRTVEEQDNVALTIVRHEMDVAKWINTAKWKELAET